MLRVAFLFQARKLCKKYEKIDRYYYKQVKTLNQIFRNA